MANRFTARDEGVSDGEQIESLGGEEALDETLLSRPDAAEEDPEVDREDPTATLVVVGHPDGRFLGRVYELSPGTSLVIGRARSCNLRFPDVPQMSRRHFQITRSENDVVLEDLGSTNGTFRNGARIEKPTRLASGDRVQVEDLILKFFQGERVDQAYHEAVYDLVMRDELTSIFNRRKFEEELERDFARARRHDRPLSLVVFDVDDFKTVNDTFGHLGGDRVLQQLAEVVGGRLRRDSVFARLGGDEFAILCPEVDGDGAAVLARRLQAILRDHEFVADGSSVPVTCSFGVAELESHMEDPLDVYRRADEALYRSKEKGRDTVTIAIPDL